MLSWAIDNKFKARLHIKASLSMVLIQLHDLGKEHLKSGLIPPYSWSAAHMKAILFFKGVMAKHAYFHHVFYCIYCAKHQRNSELPRLCSSVCVHDYDWSGCYLLCVVKEYKYGSTQTQLIMTSPATL